MRRRISIRGRVRPSVRPYVPRYFRSWKVRILGASCAVYPALFGNLLASLGWNERTSWWTDRQTDGQMDKLTEEWTNRRPDRRTNSTSLWHVWLLLKDSAWAIVKTRRLVRAEVKGRRNIPGTKSILKRVSFNPGQRTQFGCWHNPENVAQAFCVIVVMRKKQYRSLLLVT